MLRVPKTLWLIILLMLSVPDALMLSCDIADVVALAHV